MNEKPVSLDSEFIDEPVLPILRKGNHSKAFGDLLRTHVGRWDDPEEFIDESELPILRKGNQQGVPPADDSLLKELRQIAGVSTSEEPEAVFHKKLTTRKKVEKESPPPAPLDMREVYKNSIEGSLRKDWSNKLQKGELSWSGLPTYMHKLVEGQEKEHEKEIANYCKLAGLRYKTSRDTLKERTREVKTEVYNTILEVTAKLEKLVDSYHKLEAY